MYTNADVATEAVTYIGQYYIRPRMLVHSGSNLKQCRVTGPDLIKQLWFHQYDLHK